MIEPNDVEIDALLHRSLAGPIPSLPIDFEQQIVLGIQERSRATEQLRRRLFAGYAFVSAFVCATIMVSQGLSLGVTAVAIALPLGAIIPVLRPSRKA